MIYRLARSLNGSSLVRPHGAAVVGDAVGDPFKDTAAPAMNILLKLMTVVSLVFAPVILAGHKLLLRSLGF